MVRVASKSSNQSLQVRHVHTLSWPCLRERWGEEGPTLGGGPAALCRGTELVPLQGAFLWLGLSLGAGFLTGAGCSEWVLEYRVELELFCGIPAADKEAEPGRPHWEDSESSWMSQEGLTASSVSPNKQRASSTDKAGPLASWKEKRTFCCPPCCLCPKEHLPRSSLSGHQFHNLGASWVPGPGQMPRSSVVTSYQVLGTTLNTKG